MSRKRSGTRCPATAVVGHARLDGPHEDVRSRLGATESRPGRWRVQLQVTKYAEKALSARQRNLLKDDIVEAFECLHNWYGRLKANAGLVSRNRFWGNEETGITTEDI